MIFIWELIQLVLIVVIFIIGLTQLVLPPLFGWPLFWLFRETDTELMKIQENLSEVEKSIKIKGLKDKIKNLIQKSK